MQTSDRSLGFVVFLVCAFASLNGCSQASNDACADLCDGIARCRMGNDDCADAGMTAREPFMTDCVAVCGDIEPELTDAERSDALLCLECLRTVTDFAECDGNIELDDLCETECTNPGSIVFRNAFFPTLYDDYACLNR